MGLPFTGLPSVESCVFAYKSLRFIGVRSSSHSIPSSPPHHHNNFDETVCNIMPYQREDLPLPEKGTRVDGTDTTHSTNRCDPADGVIDNNVPKRDQTKPDVYDGLSSLNTARSSIKSRKISLSPSYETALYTTTAMFVGSGLASILWSVWGHNDQLPVNRDI